MAIKILSGAHLTSTNKKHINLLIDMGKTEAKCNNISYWLTEKPKNRLEVVVGEYRWSDYHKSNVLEKRTTIVVKSPSRTDYQQKALFKSGVIEPQQKTLF